MAIVDHVHTYTTPILAKPLEGVVVAVCMLVVFAILFIIAVYDDRYGGGKRRRRNGIDDLVTKLKLHREHL